MLDGLAEEICNTHDLSFELTPGRFGLTLDIGKKDPAASSG
jgi:hypothetical protein